MKSENKILLHTKQESHDPAPDMHGVDSILAMPQWYINFNLKKLLEYGKTANGDSLQDVKLCIKGENWLNGTVGSLRVALHIPDAPSKVRLFIEFTDGTMDYYSLETMPPTRKQASIAGLKIAIDVNLAVSDLLDNKSIPDDVKKQVAQLLQNIGPGAFTIRQLLMDLQSASVGQYATSETHFPEQMDASARVAVQYYMAVYLETISQTGGHILGYTVVVGNPGKSDDPVATFPPTSIRMVSNQYQDEQAEDKSTTDLDCLLYLMMTKGQAHPKTLPTAWGNFVSSGQEKAGKAGTLAISRARFISDFLLPRMSKIATSYLAFSDSSETSLLPVINKVFGALGPTTSGGAFESGKQRGHQHLTNTLSNDDVYYESEVKCTLECKPGTNKIIVERNTIFSMRMIHWYGVTDNAVKNETFIEYQIPITLEITLKGIHDGKLEVAATMTIPHEKPNTLYGSPYGWMITRSEGDFGFWDSIKKTFDSVFYSAVEMSMPSNLLADAIDLIQKEFLMHPFVFPGGNQLFMADPCFDASGNLQVSVQYKK